MIVVHINIIPRYLMIVNFWEMSYEICCKIKETNNKTSGSYIGSFVNIVLITYILNPNGYFY